LDGKKRTPRKRTNIKKTTHIDMNFVTNNKQKHRVSHPNQVEKTHSPLKIERSEELILALAPRNTINGFQMGTLSKILKGSTCRKIFPLEDP